MSTKNPPKSKLKSIAAKPTAPQGSKNSPETDKPKNIPLKAARYLVIMGAIMSCMVVVANLAAIKLWDFFGIPVDGGIIMFPLTYILGDLIVEIYGQRTANTVATCGLGLGLLTCILLWLVAALPGYPGADNSAFIAISGMASRIFLASIFSFWCSQRLNNFLFVKIRQSTGQSLQSEIHPSVENNSQLKTHEETPKKHLDQFWFRALSSSFFAHLLDAIVFETAAFLGRLPFWEFLAQAGFAFIAGLILETLFLPLTSYLAKRLKSHLHFENGHEISEQIISHYD